jgi:hypothetical protein
MKLKPKTYFILAAIFGVTFFVLLYLKIDFLRYGFLGAAIGACIRGFYEQSKVNKEIKDKTQ